MRNLLLFGFFAAFIGCIVNANTFDPDDVVDVEFTIGDPSASESERWKMTITGGGITSPIQPQSEGFGNVNSRTFNQFRKGNSYDVTVQHVATDPQYLQQRGSPDYDYEARVEVLTEDVVHWIQDDQDLLGTDYGNDTNTAAGKTAYLHLVKVELNEIDASNPAETKITYSILPEDLTFGSASLQIGEDQTFEELNVSGTVEFTFDQNTLLPGEGLLIPERDITLTLTFDGQRLEVHDQLCRVDNGLSGPENGLISAFFPAENIGLKFYNHTLLNEIYYKATYPGAEVSGKTIYTRKATSSLFINDNPIGWGERHQYSYGDSTTPWLYMGPISGDFMGAPGYTYQEIIDNRWIEDNAPEGIADTDSLVWRISNEIVVSAIPIVNSSVEVPLE